MNTIKKAIPASHILADTGYAPVGTNRKRFATQRHTGKLLAAAAAFNIGRYGYAHRNAFFAYIPCYVFPVFVEPLQRELRTSWAMYSPNTARYGLKSVGYNYICSHQDQFETVTSVHPTDYYTERK